MLILNVPFKEKDIAKKYGAKWTPEIKKWYVSDRKDYYKFIKWIPGSTIIFDYVYLVISNRQCFKCNHKIKVITFAVEKYIEIYHILDRILDEDEAEKEGDVVTEEEKAETARLLKETFDIETICNDPSSVIRITDGITPEELGLKEYLYKNFNYYYSRSNIFGSYYHGNHCQHCGVLQGNSFLHDWGGPFYIDSAEKAKELVLYRIKLKDDLAVSTGITYNSGDDLIKEYATIKDFDFEL